MSSVGEFKAARDKRRVAMQDGRRAHILQSAAIVFAREGLDGATMRKIAAAAGYAVGALYLHFSAKEEIYGELLSLSLARLAKAIRAEIPPTLPALPRAAAAARGFFRYYLAHPDELELGLYLKRRAGPKGLSPELDRQLNGRLIGVLELVAQPLREALPQAPERANRLTVRLVALITGSLILERTGRLRMLEQTAEKLIDDALSDLLETEG